MNDKQLFAKQMVPVYPVYDGPKPKNWKPQRSWAVKPSKKGGRRREQSQNTASGE